MLSRILLSRQQRVLLVLGRTTTMVRWQQQQQQQRAVLSSVYHTSWRIPSTSSLASKRRCWLHQPAATTTESSLADEGEEDSSILLLQEETTTQSTTTSSTSTSSTTTHTNTTTSKKLKRNFGDGAPKQELNNWYARNYPQHLITEHCFHRETIMKSNDSSQYWWTATFTCPVTGKIYKSGTLLLSSLEHRELLLPREEEVVSCCSDNNNDKVYYGKAKWAEHAACARAIDAIQYQEKKISVPRLCMEDPAAAAAEEEDDDDDVSYNTTDMMKKEDPPPFLSSSPEKKHAAAMLGISLEDDPAAASSHYDEEDASSLMFSGEEETHKAVLAGAPHYNEEDENLSMMIQEEEEELVTTPSTIVGLTEYPPIAQDDEDNADELYTIQYLSDGSDDDTSMTTKNTLERVMDAWAEGLINPDGELSFSSSAPPSHNMPLYSSWKNPSRQRKIVMADAWAWYKNFQKSILGGNNRSDNSSRRRRRKKKKKSRAPTEFQTTALPFSLAAGNTILTALANANQSIPQELYNNDDDLLTESKEIESLAKQIVDLLWQQSSLEKQQQQPQPPNADTYIAYLRCLAGPTPQAVAQRAEILLQGMMGGVSISSTTSNDDGDSIVLPQPTTGTFNTVIQLWSRVGGELGRNKVKHVYSLLLDNTTGRHNDVKPNRETFLSLLASMANGASSSEDDNVDVDGCPTCFDPDQARQWISQMENFRDSLQDETLQPNVQVYNAPLRWSGGGGGSTTSSRSSYSRFIPWDRHDVMFQTGFKDSQDDDDELTQEARRMEEWLADMEQQHDKTAAAPPDIETYESVIQAWVRTGTLDGLLQAESLALRVIAASCPTPNDGIVRPRLQTFHPILAAWVHSGDERGPAKIQEWINRLDHLSKTSDVPEVKPDGRIYASLVRAWHMRLKRLIEEQEASESESEETDASTTETEEEKTTNYLDLSPSNEGESANMTPLEAAKKCAECLEGLCDELRQVRVAKEEPEFLLEGGAFNEVVQAWGDLALSMQSSSSVVQDQTGSFTRNDAVEQVVQTVKLLLDTIRFYIDYEFNEQGAITGEALVRGELDGTSKGGGGHSRQLRHLVHSAPKVYAKAVSILNALDQVEAETRKIDLFQRMGAGDNFFTQYLPRIEVMLRRSEEYRVVLTTPHHQADLSPASNASGETSNSDTDLGVSGQRDVDEHLVYNDLYSYDLASPPTEDASSDSQLELYLQIVAGCKNLTASHEVGDVIRLCMLILEGVKRLSPAETERDGIDVTELYSGIISVVGSKVSNSSERAALLNRLGESVSFFEDSKGSRSIWADRIAVFSEIESADHVMKTKVMEQHVDRDTSSRVTARSRRRVRLKKRHKKSSC